MRNARVACGSATPAVVIMVGPAHEGTSRASTQEATVSSATEPLRNPARGRPDRIRRDQPAARDAHTDTEACGDE
jgi:hypothetical protein